MIGIIFAEATDNRRSEVVFSQRDLNFKTIQHLDRELSAVFKYNSDNYGQYINHLPYLFHAYLNNYGKWTRCSETDDITGLGQSERLPLRAPLMQAIFETPLSDEDVARYKGRAVNIGPQNRFSYTFARKDYDQVLKDYNDFKHLLKHNDGPVTPGYASHDGLRAISTASRLFHLFLANQSPQSTSKAMTGNVAYGVAVKDDGQSGPYVVKENVVRMPGSQMTSQNLVAGGYIVMSTAPKPAISTFDIAHLPEQGEGHLIPYFKGMIVSSEVIVPQVVSMYFARMFGGNENAVAKGVVGMMKNWRGCHTTDVAHELTHLALCIKISIETGGYLAPIIEEKIYKGCVLYTKRWILFNERIHRPVKPKELKDGRGEFMVTGTLLDRLAVEMSKLKLVDGSGTATVTSRDIDSSVKLVEEIMKREAPVSNARTEISRILVPLTYDNEEYIGYSEANLVSFLDGVINKQIPQTPMAITIESWCAKDPIFFQLQRFGTMVPSFINSGGAVRDLFKDPADDPLAKEQKYKVTKRQKGKGGITTEVEVEQSRWGWEFITVARVSSNVGYEALKEMIAKKYIRQNRDQKAVGQMIKHNLTKGSGPLLTALRLFGNDTKKPGKNAMKTSKKRTYEERDLDGEEVEFETDDEMDM